jgi:hypothetical protein
MKLREFFFGQQGAILIGAEHLTPDGMRPNFAGVLRDSCGLDTAWTDSVDRAVTLYHERVTTLHRRSAQHWDAPRLPNIVVLRDVRQVRPYTAIFPQASWLLYEDDFAVDASGEFAAFLALHQERLAHDGRLGAAVVANLSYFFLRTAEQRETFARAARKSQRPDAEAFVALADALSWLGELGHVSLAAVDRAGDEAYGLIESAGLLVPDARRAALSELLDVFRRVHRDSQDGFFREQRRGASDARTAALCDWLRDQAPEVLLTTEEGDVLWDPAQPEAVAALRSVLGPLADAPAASLQADVAMVAECSHRIMAALREPERLDAAFAELDQQESGTYLHSERKAMAYCLVQPGLDTRRSPAPPYHRLLLASRALHEWGHLLEELQLVGLPDTERERFDEARTQLVGCLEAILNATQPAVRQLAEHEAAHSGMAHYSDAAFAERLVSQLFERMPDFLANLVAARFATPAQMEAYVRNNVRSLAGEPIGPYTCLMRHAYAYQYLRFSAIEDRLSYFMQVTGFRAEFIEAGIVTESGLGCLLDAVARICDSYAIDEAAFSDLSST